MSEKGKLHVLKFNAKGCKREEAILALKEALKAVEENALLDSAYIIIRASDGSANSELHWGGVGSDLEMLGVLDMAMSEHKHYIRSVT